MPRQKSGQAEEWPGRRVPRQKSGQVEEEHYYIEDFFSLKQKIHKIKLKHGFSLKGKQGGEEAAKAEECTAADECIAEECTIAKEWSAAEECFCRSRKVHCRRSSASINDQLAPTEV